MIYLTREGDIKLIFLRASKSKSNFLKILKIHSFCPFRAKHNKISGFQFMALACLHSHSCTFIQCICWFLSNTVLLKYSLFFILKQDMFPWILDHRQLQMACTKTRNTRNSPEQPGTPRNTPKHPGTLWNTPEHPGTPRNSPEHHGTPCNSK